MKIVTAAIIFDRDSVLLARRAPGEKVEGFWEFPGGKVEDGETLQECLERELDEELGIKTKSGKELISSTYSYEHGSFEIIALESEIQSGTIQPKVHDKVSWVKVSELLLYKLAPADIPIAQYLVNNLTQQRT